MVLVASLYAKNKIITQGDHNNMTGHKNQILKHLILLLIVVIPLFYLGLFNHGLWSADEPRVAEIGREMALTNNWAIPTLNQKPFLEEPPLYYLFLAAVFKTFGGASDKIARVPSAFFAFAGVLIIFFIANRLFGPRVALLSGVILATSVEYIRVAHWVLVDSTLTFFVFCAMGFFITGYLSENYRKKLLCYILLYVSCTLAFYTKGFVGIVIPGLSILIFLAVEKNLKEILKMWLWLGILIFIILTVPWFIVLWHQGGEEYFNIFLLHNHLQRFFPASMAVSISGGVSGHHHHFYYYLFAFPGGFFPWSILLIPVLYHAFSKTGKLQGLSEKGRLFSKCWFLTGIIFLSIASTKRTLYLLPLFAPFAMLSALFIDHASGLQRLNKMGKIFIWILGILLFVIGLGLTPAYFYIKKAYLLTIPNSFSVSIVTVSILVIALSFAAIRYLLQRNMKRYWISVHISIILAFTFVLVSFLPILDLHKSFIPFCKQIMVAVSADQSLYGYKADETLRGAVPFYTGRYIVEIEDLESGPTILRENDPFFIIIRDQRGGLEKELLSTGRLHILVKQEMGPSRALVMLSNKAQSTLTIPDPFKKRPNR